MGPPPEVILQPEASHHALSTNMVPRKTPKPAPNPTVYGRHIPTGPTTQVPVPSSHGNRPQSVPASGAPTHTSIHAVWPRRFISHPFPEAPLPSQERKRGPQGLPGNLSSLENHLWPSPLVPSSRPQGLLYSHLRVHRKRPLD